MSTDAIETLDPVTEELIGIAAAIACHCEPCFMNHYNEALNLGIRFQAIEEAANLARSVCKRHQKHIDEFVTRRMGKTAEALEDRANENQRD